MNNKTLFKQSVSDNKNLMTGWSTRVLYFFKKINLGLCAFDEQSAVQNMALGGYKNIWCWCSLFSVN
jgi:hypothetical protein